MVDREYQQEITTAHQQNNVGMKETFMVSINLNQIKEEIHIMTRINF